MASRGKRGGAGDRLLESKHVIGLFMGILLFCSMSFVLGYLMGRSQYDDQLRAATNPKSLSSLIPHKSDAKPQQPDTAAKNNGTDTDAPSDTASQPSSDWNFYKSGKSGPPDDTLKASSSPVKSPSSKTITPVSNVQPLPAPSAPLKPSKSLVSGSYTVQVAALRREADALGLASHLRKKKFPAFVASPQKDKYYHVQVGPYPDAKSAEAAKKGLESAGFNAIVKH